ncbi:MAG: NADH-quinone oxidoreductase subunit A [Phycisphaerales bacterium]|nr:MAG: NADH-quinone oxidoreductase subunit A [Phycisphaerales bacterium]
MLLASIEPYAAIGVTILVVMVVAAGQLIVAQVFGPKVRHGPVKDRPYESGMPVVVDTHRRFNVRFFLVAMLFLLFDVELIFVWPWARVFHHAATTGATIPLEDGTPVGKGFLAVGMGIFFALLLFGLLYEWKRGALEWD